MIGTHEQGPTIMCSIEGNLIVDFSGVSPGYFASPERIDDFAARVGRTARAMALRHYWRAMAQ